MYEQISPCLHKFLITSSYSVQCVAFVSFFPHSKSLCNFPALYHPKMFKKFQLPLEGQSCLFAVRAGDSSCWTSVTYMQVGPAIDLATTNAVDFSNENPTISVEAGVAWAISTRPLIRVG